MDLLNQTYLADIAHYISQAALVPVIVLLILFVAFSLWSIGSIIVEFCTEHRNFKVQMPPFLASLSAAKPAEIPDVVAQSGLLNRQKTQLLVLWDYRCLRREAHVALAKRLLANEDQRYEGIVSRTDTAAKVSPMLGLMGTLVPLGPGIVALGQSDLSTLAGSIGVAFDTTVCGLIAAVICLVISRIRRKWYENYMISLESSMTTLLEIVDDMREAGALDVTTPQTSAIDLGFVPKEYQLTMVKGVVDASSNIEDRQK